MARSRSKKTTAAPRDRVLNRRLKAHCEAKGVSEDDLVVQTGWTRRKVQRILSGRTRILADHLPVLCRILDKTSDEILFGAPTAEPAVASR